MASHVSTANQRMLEASSWIETPGSDLAMEEMLEANRVPAGCSFLA